MERISENQLLILKLLAKALFNIQIKLPEKIDWNGICKEGISQTVLPLIYKVLGEVMPSEEKAKWHPAEWKKGTESRARMDTRRIDAKITSKF